jgi:hypothetical protein
MAFPIPSLNAQTQRLILPAVWDNVFLSNALFARLYARTKTYEATDGIIRFPTMLTKNTNAISYTYGSELPTTIQETTTAGELAVAAYNCAISLPGLDVVQNKGRGQVINMLKNEVYNADHALRDLMGVDLFGVNQTGTGLVGLQVPIDDGTNFPTYAGINKAAYPGIKGFYSNAGGGALSYGNAQSVYINSSIDNQFATLVIVPYIGLVKLSTLLQPQQRFGAEDIWKFGPTNIAFGNAPVIADPHQSTNLMTFINENFLHLYTNMFRNFIMEDFVKPSNQDAYVSHIKWLGQVICESPRLQGVLANVNFAL